MKKINPLMYLILSTMANCMERQDFAIINARMAHRVAKRQEILTRISGESFKSKSGNYRIECKKDDEENSYRITFATKHNYTHLYTALTPINFTQFSPKEKLAFIAHKGDPAYYVVYDIMKEDQCAQGMFVSLKSLNDDACEVLTPFDFESTDTDEHDDYATSSQENDDYGLPIFD